MFVVPFLLIAAAAQASAPPASSTPPPAGATAAAPNTGDAADLAEFYKLVDTNHDGTITRAEFDGFFAAAQAEAKKQGTAMDPSATQGLATFFGMMDTNGDGRVTPAEQAAFADMAAKSDAQ